MNKKKENNFSKLITSVLSTVISAILIALILFEIGINRDGIPHTESPDKIVDNIQNENQENIKESESNYQERKTQISNGKDQIESDVQIVNVRILDYVKDDKEYYLVENISGRKSKIISSILRLEIPLNQDMVSFIIEDLDGEKFGSLNAVCCTNNLSIKFNNSH